MALNDNIKARRTRLKLSQEYVASRLGISRQAVAKWEAGRSEPSAANLAELAALLETSVSELVEPGSDDAEREAERSRLKARRWNAGMLLGRLASIILVNVGWDGYSSGLYGLAPAYWLAVLGAGLVLLLVTTLDMNRRCAMQRGQLVIGAVMFFSIFFLPGLIPLGNVAISYALADIVVIACLVALNLKYWRRIWDVRSQPQEG